jgi:hypothetical protein
MTPTLTATCGTVYKDTLEQDNADMLSSRLNDIGDPTKWVTAEEMEMRIEKSHQNLLRKYGYA